MKKQIKIIIALAVLVVAISMFSGLKYVLAEQSGSSPESNATSRILSLYNDLSALTFGSDTDTPDWGTLWNRIKTAAKWVPNGTAATGDVVSGKTFFNTTRSSQNGAYNAANLSVGTVKNSTAFGVGLTGQYPSATYPLTGAGTVAGTSDVKSGKVAWSNDGTQISGAMVATGPCPNQAFYDGSGSATQANNCNQTWVAPGGSIAGTDATGKDPVTGLIWSQALYLSGSSVAFSASSISSWSWKNTGANNVTVGNLTAIQLCNSSSNPAGASVWRLPTQKELMQAYIDGSYWNLTQPNPNFWSATETNAGSNAYYTYLYSGTTSSTTETTSYYVRCVR
jgi:hypothetical protein